MITDERTNEQISAALAERLLHWKQGPFGTWFDHDGLIVNDPIFASDHNAALGLVVDAMLERPGYNSFECGATKSGIYYAVFRKNHGPSAAGYSENNEALPRAICLAAEAALDAEEAQG